MHIEYVRSVFWQALEVQHDKKCNFALIDIKVGLLLMLLVSMKAKVCLYQVCIRFFIL